MLTSSQARGLVASHRLQTERKELLTELRSGTCSVHDILLMGTIGSESIPLRTLLETAYSMSPSDAGYLLSALGVHDWANTRVGDISPYMAARILAATNLYERDYAPQPPATRKESPERRRVSDVAR